VSGTPRPAGQVGAAGPADAAHAHAADTLAREATLAEIQAFVQRQGRRVLTFAGYSGAGYEDPQAMLTQAARVLDMHDPARTLVNIGATAEGVGAVYALARQRGFTTMGIVSTLARDEHVPLSPWVQQVFYVADPSWGGRLPGPDDRLSPTSAAIVELSDELVLIGGGAVACDEALAARRAGKPVCFVPADMAHAPAVEKARRRGEPPPDLRGEAHASLSGS
jgi:hypothetical protein